MKIAIEGCCHGELDKIYETLAYLEEVNNIKVDLLLICGDFQSVRNKADLHCMAVPTKYQCMNTFYKYYSGEKKAPILTVFIGGNHEASNYLQELPYGGWVAPNIFYMGYANVICFGGLRIAGLSGIYKAKDYRLGHFERPPYSEDTKRSVYHVRNVEVFRLKQISRPLDIVLSHDWPRGIYNFGNVNTLLNRKPFFREQVESDTLGSPPAEELLYKLQPDYWFSAHLHTKFAAHVEHQTEGVGSKTTKFLSLDKCLPRRQFLQVLDFPHDEAVPLKLKLDPEWLCILKSTNHLLSLKRSSSFMPGPGCSEKWDFRISDEEIESIKEDFGNDLTIPENFTTTVPAYTAEEAGKRVGEYAPPSIQVNPQTTLLCTMLELSDPNAMFLGLDSSFALQPDDAANLSSAQESDEDINSDGNETDDVNATYESSIDVTFNSSFNPEEIPLDNEEDDEGISEMENESEANISTASSGAGDEEECLASRLSGVNSIDQSSELREDDDELKSILAEQGASRSTDGITVGEIIVENVNETASVLTGAMASTCQPVTSAIVATSPRQPSGSENEKSSQDEGDDDEFQAIMAAQSKQKTSPSQSDVSFDGDKSALVESSSSSRALASKQKYDMNKTVDTEVLPTSKKLKRRNLTMYSGGEDV